MAVTLREIYLNQLASGTDDPKLRARVEAEEGKLDEGEVSRASAIGSTKTSTSTSTKTSYLSEVPEDYEYKTPTNRCPSREWEVKYFDKTTRQYEYVTVSAVTSGDAERLVKTLKPNGGFYSADVAGTRSDSPSSGTTSQEGLAVGTVSSDSTYQSPTTDTSGTAATAALAEAYQSNAVIPTAENSPIPFEYDDYISSVVNYAQIRGVSGTALLSVARKYAYAAKIELSDEQMQWIVDYSSYILYQQDTPYMPVAQSINDYVLNHETWVNESARYEALYAENKEYIDAGYTQAQIDSYTTEFNAFASKYGDLDDYKPADLWDYLVNYDQAQQQLEAWRLESGSEAAGFTDAQDREFSAYWDYYNEYAPVGTPKPVDIGDYFNNYDYFQQQLGLWQQTAELQGGIGGTTGTGVGTEFYKEPRMGQAFTDWVGQQEQFSSAMQQFTEGKYASLRSQFDWEAGRLEPSGTEEAALVGAEHREKQWRSWLTQETPEIEERYWSQRPQQRGEQLWAYNPPTRTINW